MSLGVRSFNPWKCKNWFSRFAFTFLVLSSLPRVTSVPLLQRPHCFCRIGANQLPFAGDIDIVFGAGELLLTIGGDGNPRLDGAVGIVGGWAVAPARL